MALQLFKIETVEVASPVSSITFSNIPQGYTDLIVKFSIRFDLPYDAANVNLRFNSDSASNYSIRRIKGSGTSLVSDSASGTSMTINYGAGNNLTANTFSSADIYIPNYTGSTYKSLTADIVTENYASAAYTVSQAGLWTNTAAITNISLGCDGNWVANSTATLYGVL